MKHVNTLKQTVHLYSPFLYETYHRDFSVGKSLF